MRAIAVVFVPFRAIAFSVRSSPFVHVRFAVIFFLCIRASRRIAPSKILVLRPYYSSLVEANNKEATTEVRYNCFHRLSVHIAGCAVGAGPDSVAAKRIFYSIIIGDDERTGRQHLDVGRPAAYI
jgi:hypothetical protein